MALDWITTRILRIHVYPTALNWCKSYRRQTSKTYQHSLNCQRLRDFILTQERTLPRWKHSWFPSVIHINRSSLDYLTKKVHFPVKCYILAVDLLLLMTPKSRSWAVLSFLNPYLVSISSECSPRTTMRVEGTEAGVNEKMKRGKWNPWGWWKWSIYINKSVGDLCICICQNSQGTFLSKFYLHKSD